jgi:hypothetical protein
MKVTAAQPLTHGSEGGALEPSPLLTPAEAEAEAFVLMQEGGTYELEPLEDVPAETLGVPLVRLLSAGKLALYTHRMHLIDGPPSACVNYLVCVEDNPPRDDHKRRRAG